MTWTNHIVIKNIYYMLAYAFQTLRHENLCSLGIENFDNVHNIFAAILGKGIGQQLKQGLYREYTSHIENIPLVHGRIEMVGTIRNMTAHKRMLTCEYDELSENNLFNQILKTTVLLLLRCEDVKSRYKDVLKRVMTYFSGIDTINPSLVSWQTVRFHRNNQTYRILLNLCQLIMEGMLQTTAKGEYRLASFVDEQQLYRLYEKFILEYYRKEYPMLEASASQIPWVLDDDNGSMLPVMQSDIMLTYKGNVLIIDAKFYSHILSHGQYGQKGKINSANLYQIFTYVKNKTAELADKSHNVSGMLLYARTDEPELPDVTYHMSGNRIAVRTLDLNSDFSSIKSVLNRIVREYFGL